MLKDSIENEIRILNQVVLDISKTMHIPTCDGKIYYHQHGGRCDAYLVTGTDRKYVRKKDYEAVIGLIARTEHDRLVLECAQKRLQVLERFKKELASCEIADACKGMHPESLGFVSEVQTMDKLVVKQWEEEEPYLINDMPGRKYKTDRGEMVRSKSEALIANRLFHAGVPYRYEFPIWVGSRTVFPDFMVLNVRTGKEYLLEHLGQIDKAEYRSKNLPRLDMYAEGGHVLGTDLLLTFESDEYPLNMKTLDCYIEHLFK